MRLISGLFAATAALALLGGADPAPEKTPDTAPDKLKFALIKTESVELYALDPNPSRVKPKETFHSWKVTGSVIVRDISARASLRTELLKGIVDGKDGKVGDHFAPRYGMRMVYEDTIYDVVISFEDKQAEVYGNNKKLARFPLSALPQPAFDKVIKDERVTVAPLPKKEDPLPGFPDIKYNADILDVTVRGDRPLLAVIRTDYDKEKKEIIWVVEVQNDISYEDFIAIRNLWEDGSSGGGKGPVAYFFNKDKENLYTRDLKETGKLRNARKGDTIRLILAVGDGFPGATSMEIRAPLWAESLYGKP